MSKITKVPVWHENVAEAMVARGLSFKQALGEIGVPIKTDEADKVENSKDFRKTFESVRNRYFDELGANPTRTKQSVIGEMIWLCRALSREGSFDKALEGYFKVAKVEGWMGSEATVNVFAGLTQRDIENARKELNIPKSAEVPNLLGKPN